LDELALFEDSGNLLARSFDPDAWQSLGFSWGYAVPTGSGFIQPHHLFLGILRQGGAQVRRWLTALKVEREELLESWEELFGGFLGNGSRSSPRLNREYLENDLLKLLRDAWNRTRRKGRPQVDVSCLLICILSQAHGLVPGCFERCGVSPDWLVLQAERVELDHANPLGLKGPKGRTLG